MVIALYDEFISQALTREIFEESGFTLDCLDILQPADSISSFSDIVAEPHPISLSIHHHPKTNYFHSDIAFAFITDKEVPGPTEDRESNEFVLLTKKELLELTEEDIFPHTLEMFIHVLDKLLGNWVQVKAKSRVDTVKTLDSDL